MQCLLWWQYERETERERERERKTLSARNFDSAKVLPWSHHRNVLERTETLTNQAEFLAKNRELYSFKTAWTQPQTKGGFLAQLMQCLKQELCTVQNLKHKTHCSFSTPELVSSNKSAENLEVLEKVSAFGLDLSALLDFPPTCCCSLAKEC